MDPAQLDTASLLAQAQGRTGRLAGKIGVVFAAVSGIGRVIALALAREGAVVLAVDVDPQKLEELRLEHAAITPVNLDVLSKTELNSLADQLQQLHIIVNAASISSSGNVLKCSEEDWDFLFEVNVKAMFLAVKILLPIMCESGGGSIINMSSTAWDQGVPSRCAYAASKAAVIGFTKSVAADFASFQVRCNVVCMGQVESSTLDEKILKHGGDPDEVRRDINRRQPMGRVGSPEEAAALCVFLASEDASYMTGTIQVIDGGQTLGLNGVNT